MLLFCPLWSVISSSFGESHTADAERRREGERAKNSLSAPFSLSRASAWGNLGQERERGTVPRREDKRWSPLSVQGKKERFFMEDGSRIIYYSGLKNREDKKMPSYLVRINHHIFPLACRFLVSSITEFFYPSVLYPTCPYLIMCLSVPWSCSAYPWYLDTASAPMTDPLFSTGEGAGDNLLDGRFADNDSRWNSPPCYVVWWT